MKMDFIEKTVLIRSDRAGVFYGTLAEKSGDEVILTNARRIWCWQGACSCTDLALIGTTCPEGCKITRPVEAAVILGVIEIIPMTDAAKAALGEVPEWTMK